MSHQTTNADLEIAACLERHQSFSVVAGAGSGKTTSLVTALDLIRANWGTQLRQDGQKVLCVTYTDRAVKVISSRVGWDNLFCISTLHSFLWGLIGQFTREIRSTLASSVIPAHIHRHREKDNGGKSKKALSARQKVEELTQQRIALQHVQSFTYGSEEFSNFAEGVIGHDDLIMLAAAMLTEIPVLRSLVGQMYPFILVDEAQDTFVDIVSSLNKICEDEGLPLIGYFGDPMQQIYDGRAGHFSGPQGSPVITKEENFRSSQSVIALLNRFRTDVVQIAAGRNAGLLGSVQLRLIQAEDAQGTRGRYSREQLERTSNLFDEALSEWGWDCDIEVKHLFLVRQMIARRAGFMDLQALFTGPFSSSKSEDAYKSGEHYLLKPFIQTIWPLIQAQKCGDQRATIELLATNSPAFSQQGRNAKEPLAKMTSLAVHLGQELERLWYEKPLSEILHFCRENALCHLSRRLVEALEREPRKEAYVKIEHEIDKGEWLADEFFTMQAGQLGRLAEFINENTAYSTQHGVKGEEYKNVVVVFDDVESAWSNYSFTKLLTPNTSGTASEGQLTRSRRLAYVCFSRATVNLRILLFTPDPTNAKEELIENKLFLRGQIQIAGADA